MTPTPNQLLWCLASLLCISGCGSVGADATPTVTAPSGVWLDTVRYNAGFDTSGVTIGDDNSLTIVSTTGDTITIEVGYLVTYWATLVSCETVAQSSAAVQARAVSPNDHGEDLDPSSLVQSRLESLTPPSDVQLGTISFEETEYCRTHYLVGEVTDALADTLPESPDLFGLSLYIEGFVSYEDGDVEALLIQSDLAYGELYYLSGVISNLDSSSEARALELTFTRNLGTLFDGVQIRGATQSELAFGVLSNLIGGILVEGTLQDALD